MLVVTRFSELQTRRFDIVMDLAMLVSLEMPPTGESIASSSQTKDGKYLSASVK
jgi:hypothetical protein